MVEEMARDSYLTDGTKYVGEFKDGDRNGKGTATYANGEKYVENIKRKRNGQGTCLAYGSKYVENLKMGKKRSELVLANGDKYVGT